MELYNELRENWERLYWDEGYSKKMAKDHAKYESAEDDDQDFNPYRFLHLPLLANHENRILRKTYMFIVLPLPFVNARYLD